MKQGNEAEKAKKSMWTNGKPPFPLLVGETKRQTYRAIVEKYLNGTNLGHIAIWLTDNKIPTPYNIKPDGKNKGWSNITVQRLLESEIHLGHITYGKTRSKRGQVELVPEEGLKSWELMKC